MLNGLIPSWLVGFHFKDTRNMLRDKRIQEISIVDTVQEFLIELDIKQCMHKVETGIFTLNNIQSDLSKS